VRAIVGMHARHRLCDCDWAQEPLCIVTEFAVCGALDAWLRIHLRTAPTRTLAHIALGVARGVAHLHAEGAVRALCAPCVC
jgi:hypothetical protein